MKIKTLRLTNECYDHTRWEELEAISKGGKKFHGLMNKFLPQNALEPVEIYQARKSQAHFHSHSGSIMSLYVSWLFAADFTVAPHYRGTPDVITDHSDFYGLFQEDVGDETTFSAFTRERFREALTMRKSHWLIELPSNGGEIPADKIEWEDRQLGRATLKSIDNCDVLDWRRDEQGRFEWVTLYSCDDSRRSWLDADNTIIETWSIYDEENITTFEIEYPKNAKPSDETEIAVKSILPHGFTRVPLMTLDIPEELCIGEQTRDTELEHFRLDNALSWLIRRTCYAQPVFNLADGETMPTMGTGYGIVMGVDDKMGWTAPPAAPFDILQKNVEAKRDAIYRVTHTMAQAVDNNAETVGRSADSKEIDAAATRIMLQAYGTYVAKAIEETYETISEARGETDYEWSVEGFSGYDTATVASLISNATNARMLGIPSETFHKELALKVANAMLAGEDQRKKDIIRGEIVKSKFDVSSMNPETELLLAKAEEQRAKAAAAPHVAGAAVKTADASMITAKKPTPKKPVGK